MGGAAVSDNAYADLRALAEQYQGISGLTTTRMWLVKWYETVSPARLLALLADLDAAERSNAAMEQHVVNLNQRLDEETARRVAARAEVTAWRGSLDRLTVQWDNERHERAEAEDALTVEREKVEAVRALPLREWDENDADSIEANAARAYNHALAKVWALLDTQRATEETT